MRSVTALSDESAVLMHRYCIVLRRFRVMSTAAIREDDDELSYLDIFTLPIGLYITWQLGYWFITEVTLMYRYRATFVPSKSHN